MKMTNLQIVQSVLNDIEGDAITAIGDTVESSQILSIMRDIYFQMVTNKTIPEHKALVQLTTVGGTGKNQLLIPTTVAKVQDMRYNKRITSDTMNRFAPVTYLCPEEFLDLIYARASDATDMVTVTDQTSSLTYPVRNDFAPTHWTSFDDQYVSFDSYDVSVDASGLVGTKSMCWATTIPVWSTADASTADMDDNLFPLFLAEVKATAFANLKQQQNPKIERQVRNQKVSFQHDKYRTKTQEESFSTSYTNYGRK
jgi:hypothetical protein